MTGRGHWRTASGGSDRGVGGRRRAASGRDFNAKGVNATDRDEVISGSVRSGRVPPMLGFPWFVRIQTFQWVTRHKRSKNFSRRLVTFEAPEREVRPRPCQSVSFSAGKITLISDFLHEIVVKNFPLESRDPKRLSRGTPSRPCTRRQTRSAAS